MAAWPGIIVCNRFVLFVVKMNKIPAYLLLVSQKKNIEVIKTYSNVLTFYLTHFNAEVKTSMRVYLGQDVIKQVCF